jgi:glycosyltransferase involved in cell wall biosynthesis
MRVLFLHATRETTSEYAVHRILADYVDQARVTCSFIWQMKQGLTTDNTQDTTYWDFGRDMSIQPKPSKLRRLLRMARSFPGTFRLIHRRIDEFHPDVLYTSQQFYEVFLGRLFSSLYRIPHLIHISYPVGPWLGYWTLRSIRMTQNLIACSEYVRQSALVHGVQPHQIETLLHGAVLHESILPKDRKWLHDRLGWPEACPIVVNVSRIDPYKGHPDLVRAFAIAHQQFPQLRLVICGTGTTGTGYEEMIRQLVVELGISSFTAFLGYQKDLRDIFAGADIFCLPTQLDALPLVVLEAMSAGLPVVAARSGGVTEMVVEGETGLLVEPGDVNGLATHLLSLSRNPQLARIMGDAGMMRARRNFDPKNIANQWADILCRRVGPKNIYQ